ncbi:hypothetical protein [Rickettsia prowazekii]|uniref:Uncharacterized protein RP473 n=2 Tax=Rickettsia prowazekii TaxID=782 RepID=Y473_RICPR|nr:hypothetical protein [Rickettsia prowazekii]Q9ZD71.1 RecName: Full=Uncharacterized protein RP473 [Rickettsia prowazekii str. Madrid E]ADE30004.1 hypothetical protein rpr22_CDS462 [Rickettsia prowazekii str. Rp22]AFE49284.1 hypothetical protein M9W_02295 [Rickettsia prowazekii str. Chernikova]AFE50130.1 hypothetical protein M9Y_02300 [Rickettsia prowazekii str. Katsinyian]AFE50975.1 hypothetical protein MA1_02295 [Rickettsia prowazekii str. BuV67-CWPP]AFE51811.1 hypothetical protein MA3_023
MQKFDSLFRSQNIFFIAIVIFILSSVILYHNRSDILKLFTTEYKGLNQITNQEKENKENAILDEKEYETLLSTKSLLNYVNSLKSSKTSIPDSEAIIHESVEVTDNIVEVPIRYTHYLLNVNLLVYNFIQDKDYSKELRILKSYPLPQNIRNILNNLEKYNNNYLVSKSNSTVVIFPIHHKWLEQLIKIEKKSPVMIVKEQDKTLILEKLNYLIYFLYSEKFMQEFVNKDV